MIGDPPNQFLNKKTTESEIVLSPETDEAKAEAIRKLEETIKATTRRLAEIDKILKMDSLEEELVLKREKLMKSTWGKNKKREEIASLETELDRIENPFKWFIINKICQKNFAILFESDIRSAEVIDDIIYRNDLKGIMCGIFEKSLESISNKTDNAVAFSSNGFYLRFKNIKELQKRGEGVDIDGPEARYDLVCPDGSTLLSGLNYREAENALRENAEKYQAEQLALFEKINSTD